MSIWKRLGIEFGGTEGHVLTIEGGKGKFKAPSGGGGNTTAVDWIPASDFAQSNGTAMVLTYTGTYPARYRSWPMVTAPAATPQAVQATWKVPLNYVSGGTISVLLYANTANDSAITMRAHYLPITVTPELTLAGQDLITAAHTVLSKNSAPLGLAILPVGRLLNAVNSVGRLDLGTMTGLAAGDLVNLHIDRETANANDLYTGTVNLLGAFITYTRSS